jgi:hypothetical protein
LRVFLVPELNETAFEPFLDANLCLEGIEALHTEPSDPFFGSFPCITAPTGGDTVRGAVFATTSFRLDVVNCQGFVVDRRVTAIGTAVIPRFFNSSPPDTLGLGAIQGSHVKNVVVWALEERETNVCHHMVTTTFNLRPGVEGFISVQALLR